MRTQFVRIVIGIVALLALVGLSPAAIQAAPAAKPANAGGFTIYLTFDDGPTGGPTDAILDTLKQYNVKATFFDEGGHIARGFGAEVRREVSEGHRVGNHLWLELTNIMYLAKPSAATLQQQYAMAEDEIHKALGDSLWAVYEKQPRLFRWPGGSPFVLPGMPNVYNYNWNVSSGDDVRGASVMRVVNNALYGYPPNHVYGVYAWGNGAILMFHDTSWRTANALPIVLKQLIKHGVSFGLLPRPGDQPGQVIGILGGVPPCANQPGNCGPENTVGG